MTFEALGVAAHHVRTLARRGITDPFPVQVATIPDGLAGRDVCGRAPTGSGKTIAFGLVIAARARRARPGSPNTLVLVPTRELAVQVATELDHLLPDGGKKSVGLALVYGGVAYGPQQKAFARGAAVVVATPGRLEDLVAGGTVDLGAVELVVVDEADRMADMGFMPAVRRLLDKTSPTRQTLLFSATLDGDVDELIRSYQRDPARHEIGTEPEQAGVVEHLFWKAEAKQRLALTADIVRTHGSTIVFCRTRHGADRIAEQLAGQGLATQALHGGRSQAAREKALQAFARHGQGVLVATDVAARGIHVPDVACVVHFDPAENGKDYIHRSGRTGRAGAKGMVVSFVTPSQKGAVRALQREAAITGPLVEAPAPSPLVERPAPAPVPVAEARRVSAPPTRVSARAAAGVPGAPDGEQRRGRGPRAEGAGPRVRGGRGSGTVRFYDHKRGFGFIMQESGPDLFVHYTDTPNGEPLEADEVVSFEIAQGDRGLLARKVWRERPDSASLRPHGRVATLGRDRRGRSFR